MFAKGKTTGKLPYQMTSNLCESDLAGVISGCNDHTMKDCIMKQLFPTSLSSTQIWSNGQILITNPKAFTMDKKKQMGCASENFGSRLPPKAEVELKQPEEPFDVKHIQLSQSSTNDELMQVLKDLNVRMTELQKKQDDRVREIEWLKEMVNQSETKTHLVEGWIDDLEFKVDLYEKPVHLIGGYDSFDWLPSFDAFSPFKDTLVPLTRMSSPRAYTSVTAVGEVIFVLGGSDGKMWTDTVECYKRFTDEWHQCAPLSCPKGSLAGVTLRDKIFAIGGGDVKNCLSCVEVIDPYFGKWISSPSMTTKRFATAAREFNGSIYTVGGCDGEYYLQSAERYDPREGYWAQLPRMNERRGCHSLAVINHQLYAIGGFDGNKKLSSVEIFDPRAPSWVLGMPMRNPRAYAGSVMINDTFYMMGGVTDGSEILGNVECFNEETGWYTSGFKSFGKRCFFSAVVL